MFLLQYTYIVIIYAKFKVSNAWEEVSMKIAKKKKNDNTVFKVQTRSLSIPIIFIYNIHVCVYEFTINIHFFKALSGTFYVRSADGSTYYAYVCRNYVWYYNDTIVHTRSCHIRFRAGTRKSIFVRLIFATMGAITVHNFLYRPVRL